MAKGGAPAPVVVQPPPPTVTQLPKPDVAETSQQLAESQLKFNPQLTAQQVQLQGQYGPQLEQQQYELQQKYGPLYRALYESMFPSQTQGLETLAQQATQRLQNPVSLTPEQQTAQQTFRQRAADELSRAMRSRANVGGTLYGGNAIEQELRAQAELQNQFAQSDIGNQLQQRQQLLQELIAAGQVIFPQVQQPNVPGYGQPVTPSPDALLNAYQNSVFVQPAAIGFPQQQPGFWSGGAGGLGNAAASAALAYAMRGCHVAEVLYGISDIRTLLARLYVFTHDSRFLRSYRRHSKAWAGWLTRLPFLKTLVRPIWDRMWQQELVECQ